MHPVHPRKLSDHQGEPMLRSWGSLVWENVNWAIAPNDVIENRAISVKILFMLCKF